MVDPRPIVNRLIGRPGLGGDHRSRVIPGDSRSDRITRFRGADSGRRECLAATLPRASAMRRERRRPSVQERERRVRWHNSIAMTRHRLEFGKRVLGEVAASSACRDYGARARLPARVSVASRRSAGGSVSPGHCEPFSGLQRSPKGIHLRFFLPLESWWNGWLVSVSSSTDLGASSRRELERTPDMSAPSNAAPPPGTDGRSCSGATPLTVTSPQLPQNGRRELAHSLRAGQPVPNLSLMQEGPSYFIF